MVDMSSLHLVEAEVLGKVEMVLSRDPQKYPISLVHQREE
jgi:hypothetical protein